MDFAEPERIDQSDEAGLITPKIIKKIYEADWCVADLSGQNANVFYELGVRHAFQKPVIHLANDINAIPFDNSHQNAIEYTHDDPQSHKRAIERIIAQVSKFDEENEPFSSLVSFALGMLQLNESGDDKDELILAIHERVANLERHQRSEQANREIVQALMSRQSPNALAGGNALGFPSIMMSDNHIDPQENKLMSLLREINDEEQDDK
ncbi:hypothetical protein [Cognatiyoonia sp. IB215182]|uniref:hypothetical protein n=1 Tax=Cognatiyoonia sp. IB215182 TaxID=3097353 RepID=UPI002A0D910C|nr:hypothetical protein [Cognatiyoonia sp. IB215182]MDX8353776.1 hypothetical protein [Cognatiyoonia sp. IB215182]